MTDAATPETATAPEVHDLASAAHAIERIIRRETQPATADDQQAAKAGESEAQTDDADAGTDDEIEHDSGVIDDEEEEVGSSPEESRYRVKVGGQETEVTLKELVKG